jgi:hypothetical protein
MVTPTLFCGSYTYLLFDTDGNIIENNSLTVFNATDNSYYFNFNHDLGNYYIKICDGSTRQIQVVSGDNMIGLTVQTWIFGLLIFLFIVFLWLTFKAHPIFLSLNGIIIAYFAYYSYTLLQNYFLLAFMSLVSIAFLSLGVIGAMAFHK